jgi:hypothetical protein
MADVKDWGIAAASNSVASPDGAQTGWLGADVGPWGRETMAAVARWNKDPSWTNFTREGIEPAGTNKAIARAGSPTNRINLTLAAGSWAGSTGAKYFPPGRLIRFDRGNANPFVYCFVVGTSIASSVLSVDVAPIGIATVPVSGYVQNGVEFYSAMESADTQRNLTPLSAMAFGGHGTTADRNAKFASAQLSRYPQGMSWFNTTDHMFQVLDGGAWLNLAPLRNNWSFGGSILEVGSNTVPPGNPNGVQVQMKFPQGDTAAISMFELAADQSLINRGSLGTATSADMGAVYLQAPTDGATSAAADKSTYCQTILYGENSIAANAGHMFFQKFDWDGTSYINTLGLQDMTPGFVDAGTLGGESAGSLLADNIYWLQSTATGPSTGQMSASQVAPVGRFALPSSMLASVADAPAGELYIEIDLLLEGSYQSAAFRDTGSGPGDPPRCFFYIGENYGISATTIPNYPTGIVAKSTLTGYIDRRDGTLFTGTGDNGAENRGRVSRYDPAIAADNSQIAGTAGNGLVTSIRNKFRIPLLLAGSAYSNLGVAIVVGAGGGSSGRAYRLVNTPRDTGQAFPYYNDDDGSVMRAKCKLGRNKGIPSPIIQGA